MKKNKLLILLSLIAIVILSSSLIVMAKNNDFKGWDFLGKVIKNTKEKDQNIDSNNNDDIIAKGKHINVTNIELENKRNIYKASGIDKSDKEIIADITKKKTLAYIADTNGFDATEEDFKVYVDALKESIAEAENKEDIYKFYEGFGGEDEYWKVMKPTFMESLKIKKYLDVEIGKYASELNMDVTDIEFIKKWNDKQEEITNNFVSSEEVQIYYSLE